MSKNKNQDSGEHLEETFDLDEPVEFIPLDEDNTTRLLRKILEDQKRKTEILQEIAVSLQGIDITLKEIKLKL